MKTRLLLAVLLGLAVAWLLGPRSPVARFGLPAASLDGFEAKLAKPGAAPESPPPSASTPTPATSPTSVPAARETNDDERGSARGASRSARAADPAEAPATRRSGDEVQAAFLAGLDAGGNAVAIEAGRLAQRRLQIVTDIVRIEGQDRQYAFRFDPTTLQFVFQSCDPNDPDRLIADAQSQNSSGIAVLADRALRTLLPSSTYRVDRFFGWAEADWGLEFNVEELLRQGAPHVGQAGLYRRTGGRSWSRARSLRYWRLERHAEGERPPRLPFRSGRCHLLEN